MFAIARATVRAQNPEMRIDVVKPKGGTFISLASAKLDERYTLLQPDGEKLDESKPLQAVTCLGSGGFGAVVKAKDRFNIPRAVKFIKEPHIGDDISDDADSSNQFIKE